MQFICLRWAWPWHMILTSGSSLWNSRSPHMMLQLLSPSSPSPPNVSRFGRDSGLHILCSSVMPGQQKQEESFDTDGRTLSISTLSLQIHLINSIYGKFFLVCICVYVVLQIRFLDGTYRCDSLDLLKYNVMYCICCVFLRAEPSYLLCFSASLILDLDHSGHLK